MLVTRWKGRRQGGREGERKKEGTKREGRNGRDRQRSGEGKEARAHLTFKYTRKCPRSRPHYYF